MSSADTPKPFDLQAFTADFSATVEAYAHARYYSHKDPELKTEEENLKQALLDRCAEAMLATGGSKEVMRIIRTDLLYYCHGNGVFLLGDNAIIDFLQNLASRIAQKAPGNEAPSDGVRREEIQAVLTDPEAVRRRVEIAESVLSRRADNDGRLLRQEGTIRAVRIPSGILLEYRVNDSTRTDDRSGVIIDFNGKVHFHPEATTCTTYLRDRSDNNPDVLADDFLRQLQANL